MTKKEEEKLKEFDRKGIHTVWIIFISFITAVLTTLAATK